MSKQLEVIQGTKGALGERLCLSSEALTRLAEFAGAKIGTAEVDIDETADAVLWIGEYKEEDGNGNGSIGYGLCAHLEDYPDEGCIVLEEMAWPDDAPRVEADDVQSEPVDIESAARGLLIDSLLSDPQDGTLLTPSGPPLNSISGDSYSVRMSNFKADRHYKLTVRLEEV